MSIHLSMEVRDPETENLLRYLEAEFGDNWAHKLEVLSCAKQWLELDFPTAFTRDDAHRKFSLLVSDDEKDLVSSSLSQVPSQRR